LIAHRGAHNSKQGIRENTLKAFEMAKNVGCWGIEFDLRLTADKVLVVHHDATLNRLWGHKEAIADLNFNELRSLVPEVPSLEEVVQAYAHKLHLFIELKIPLEDERILVRALEDLSPEKDYHLLTLNSMIFHSLSQIPKSALLLVASSHNIGAFCTLSLEENYGGVLGHYLLLRTKTINKLNAAQKIVGVGLVDSKYSLYRELNRGIHWLFTNCAADMQFLLHHIRGAPSCMFNK
jgi:glycerophosphoryl diester phosphodiesterase